MGSQHGKQPRDWDGDLAGLRLAHPGWLIVSFWVDAGHPAGRRRLAAQQHGTAVIVSGWDAGELEAKIAREEAEPRTGLLDGGQAP